MPFLGGFSIDFSRSGSPASRGGDGMTLADIIALLKKRWRLLLAIPVACAVIMAAYSFLFMKNVYTATTSMYVMAGKTVDQNANGTASTSTNLYSDLNASQMITKDVADLLTGNRIKKQTAQDLDLDNLNAYDISVQSTDDSRVINLSVTGSDAQGAVKVAKQLSSNVSSLAQDAMGVESVNVLETPEEPTQPSGPNRKLYIAIAALAGLFVAVEIVFVTDALNTKIRSEEALEEATGLPILVRVPQIDHAREAGGFRG